jgi:predicted TIM-barrel fold metal-dependent hydrolase
METDGVSAEVLYPTYLLPHFAMDDAKLQEVSFRAYNDWLIDYCNASPKRLLGIAAISVYDIDSAVKELERCAKAGMKGSIIWQAPHPDLPFHSEHYNKFWAASQDLNLPVHLHILTGHGYHKESVFGNKRTGVEAYRGSVNLKLKEIIDAFFELIFYGVLERYPKLRFVSVENEIGWMPFMLQQWDYYYNRFKKANPPPFTKNPSEYFKTQIFGTFFRDTAAGHNFEWWGQDNCMWSNDYPHGNSTWPESKKFIDRDLGHLPADIRKKLVYTNVKNLYQMDIPHPVQ